ncbi:MAG: NAD-dependent epimerase/dehydratase family protein [Nannocystaceae bacterium]
MPTRRAFLGAMLGLPTLGLAGCRARTPSSSSVDPEAAAARPMDLLILGGTGFIGPHLVRHAVARGHRVTIFTRGRRDAALPEGVIRLVGDRDGDLSALEGKRWDAVVDDSATAPERVRRSTALLRESVGRYLFTSSTGVFYPYLRPGADESTPVRLELSDPEDGSEAYGVAKAQSEREVIAAFAERATIVRPTYIVGPGDTTNRFPYWPQRLARGGEVLVPGRADDPVQIVDVRDLAALMVRLLEDDRPGTFNAAGPRERLTIAEFAAAAKAAVGPSATLIQVEDYALLEAHGIEGAVPWIMLKGNDLGHTSIRTERAIAAGLTFRSIEETVRDTLAWWEAEPEERRRSAEFAITPEQEAAVLAAARGRAAA